MPKKRLVVLASLIVGLCLAAGLILSSGTAFAAVGDITEYPIPTGGSVPIAIAAEPDGNLWFTEYNANQVAKVSLTATTVNNPPVAQGQSRTTAEDTALAVTLTATDVDGDSLTYAVLTGPAHGSLRGSGPNLYYAPAANYIGPDSFTFRAYDGTAYSNTATVSIYVTDPNKPNSRARHFRL